MITHHAKKTSGPYSINVIVGTNFRSGESFMYTQHNLPQRKQ